MEYQEILSVGIDIGTSTTQTVFSRLRMQNTAGYFAVPEIEITDKETLYKSPVHRTPMKDASLLDGDALRKLVEEDFAEAGRSRGDTATGAVIITGEAARKENARTVLDMLSEFAGDFVVSTAGPDLEAIIAGKGSGAWKHSVDESGTAANIDVGGGTSNIVLFDRGETVSVGCLDIGGRQIAVSDGRITYVSPSARLIAEAAGVNINKGSTVKIKDLKAVTDKMADLLYSLVCGREDGLLEKISTGGGSRYEGRIPDALFLSGGVADLVHGGTEDVFEYGDIGVLLGRSIRESDLFGKLNVLKSGETIRATVVGAGCYATSVTGSTISYDESLLPLKNVPVFRLADSEYAAAVAGNGKPAGERLGWFLRETDARNAVIAFAGDADMTYDALNRLSAAVSETVSGTLDAGEPALIAVESDIAKVFGQTLGRDLAGRRPVVSVDGVKLRDGEYVDLGRPLMDGLVIPVVVKTLIFG